MSILPNGVTSGLDTVSATVTALLGGKSITSANASFNLLIPGVYSSGVLLQNFGVGDMFTSDPQTLTEGRVGVDGNSVGDYVFQRSKMSLHFQANSTSLPVFYNWKAIQDAGPSVIAATAKVICPSLALDVNLTDGYLTSLPILPPHRKLAEEVVVELSWGPGWQTTSLTLGQRLAGHLIGIAAGAIANL